MQKKRVGVITFHNYDNYGAILQSYALQKKLQEIGTQPEIIDYRCDYISNPFRLVNLKKKGLFNYIYGAIGHICYIPRRFKCNKFRKHMRYSQPVIQGKMQPVAGKYDIYIAGSDQIWDYKLTNFDTTYFLDFVKDRRLDVRDDQAVEIIEQTTLDDVAGQGQVPVFRQVARIFVPEHAGQQHFVGLFVNFQQFHRAQLVVPAQHIRAGKDQLQQALANNRHSLSLKKARERAGVSAQARAVKLSVAKVYGHGL